MTFKQLGISDNITSILKTSGIINPTEIQEKSIKDISINRFCTIFISA